MQDDEKELYQENYKNSFTRTKKKTCPCSSNRYCIVIKLVTEYLAQRLREAPRDVNRTLVVYINTFLDCDQSKLIKYRFIKYLQA